MKRGGRRVGIGGFRLVPIRGECFPFSVGAASSRDEVMSRLEVAPTRLIGELMELEDESRWVRPLPDHKTNRPGWPINWLLGILFFFGRRVEEMSEVPFRRIQKVPGQEVVLRFTVCDLADRVAVKAEKDGARIAENDG